MRQPIERAGSMVASLRAAVRALVCFRYGTRGFLVGFELTERTARETIVKPRFLAVLDGANDLELRERGHVFCFAVVDLSAQRVSRRPRTGNGRGDAVLSPVVHLMEQNAPLSEKLILLTNAVGEDAFQGSPAVQLDL